MKIELSFNNERIFFTADTHFGHKNIIKYASRPFGSVEEMDKALIQNWNKRVKNEDVIFHLGDFAFGGKKYIVLILQQLRGKIYLVPGNHDYRVLGALREYVTVLSPIALLKVKNMMFTLCHYPILSWPGRSHGGIHLYGHVHREVLGIFRAVNVGVDVWDYNLVSLREVLDRLNRCMGGEKFEKF